MDLEYSSEQAMLRDSVSRLLAQRYAPRARQGYLAEAPGWSRRNWKDFVELGLTALPLPESLGGMGGGAVETQIVLEAMGRHLAVEPYIGSVVEPAAILRRGAASPGAESMAAAIVEGRLHVSLAHLEEKARYDLAFSETSARRHGNGFVISGRKVGVANGDALDRLIVSARQSGSVSAEDGISLFVVPIDRPGVTLRPYRAFDGSHLAIVELSEVVVERDARLGQEGGAFGLLQDAQDAALSAICGEAVGLIEMMLDETVSYLKTRQQFGGPIGRFQALQHRAAEMFVSLEQARSMALLAAVALDQPEPNERRRSLSAAKIQINASLRFVGQQAVQLHGGIGVTEECAVGQAFKRATMIERLFGDTSHHFRVLDALGGLQGRLLAKTG